MSKKICVVTCYKHPDYVRAKTLRAAVEALSNTTLIEVKNKNTGVLRYGEVFLKTIAARIRHRPDVYILTFRGYEMLLPIRLLTLGKPLVFDELINLVEWVVLEHGKIKKDSVAARLLRWVYRAMLQSTSGVIADTKSHAELSAELVDLPKSKFYPIAVGTDEATFTAVKPRKSKEFTVFYYGNMLPLHGLRYVIEAAKELKSEPIKFVLIGGNDKTAADVRRAVDTGANIEYKKWVQFAELPGLMASADVCLAGPFGNTLQAQHVITGKEYQYLAMKRPTIIGKNEDSGVFSDRKNAIIVEQGSATALKEAILWAYSNQDKLNDIAQAGHDLYQKEFSTPAIAKQLQLALKAFNIQ